MNDSQRPNTRRRFLSAILLAAGAIPLLSAQSTFEVASITAAKPGDPQDDSDEIRTSPGSLTMRHVTLGACIKWAYNVTGFQLSGPASLTSNRFDIVAKAAGPVEPDRLRLMLQSLLATRFKLALHRDTKDAQVYALLIGKQSPRFQESKTEGPSDMSPGRFGFTAKRTATSQLADYLAIALRKPVLDLTGLTGRYDFKLDLTVYGAQSGDMAALVITAVQEQLGLKLEPRKGPIEILIVDRVEKTPTPN